MFENIREYSPTSFEIPKRNIELALSNYLQLAKSVRGRLDKNGVAIKRVDAGSIYAKLGIRVGDVIKTVNGHRLDSHQAAMDLYMQLRDARSIRLGVIRGGRRVSLDYAITL